MLRTYDINWSIKLFAHISNVNIKLQVVYVKFQIKLKNKF